MKLLNSFTGATSKDNVKVNKPISHILFSINDIAGLVNEKIEVKLIDPVKAEAKIIIPEMDILKVGEITAQQEGLNTFDTVAIELTAGDDNDNFKGISLSNDKYLLISVSSLTSSKLYTMYGLEQTSVTDVHTVIETMYITADVPKNRFSNLEKKELLALPFTGLTSLTVYGKDGGSAEYSLDELYALQRLGNDIVQTKYVQTGEISTVPHFEELPVLNYQKLVTLPLDDVESIELETTSSFEFYLIDSQE